MSGPQRAAAEKILGFSLNGLKGPHNMMLRSPEAAELTRALGQYLRFRTGLPDRVLELAILVHARLWNDPYEWMIHAPRAASAGHSLEVIDALKAGRTPRLHAGADEAIFRFVLELERDRNVGDATFELAMRHFGERGIADITILLGQYATISMVLAVSGDGAVSSEPIPAVDRPFEDYPRG